jgi:hypothetical protein
MSQLQTSKATSYAVFGIDDDSLVTEKSVAYAVLDDTHSVVVSKSMSYAVLETENRLPDAFDFASLTGLARAQRIESGPVRITGINVPVAVAAAGDGDPRYRITSDAAGTEELVAYGEAGLIEADQYLWIDALTSPAYATTTAISVEVGEGGTSFTLTTENAPPAEPTDPVAPAPGGQSFAIRGVKLSGKFVIRSR